MAQRRTYLDHNATAPMREEVRAAVAEALALYGNPSSVHAEGRRARAAVERARAQVAALAGCEPGEVVFTGTGSEANNAVLGQPFWDGLLVSAVEHDSVLAPARASGKPLALIPVRPDGRADVGWLEQHCEHRGAREKTRLLVSVQAANNETGVLQAVSAIAEITGNHGLALHTDAVQAAGRVPLRFASSGADYMTLSAHKIGGPKGAGALVIRAGADFAPAIRGGGQEMRRRAGTENVPAIVGFGVAAELAQRGLAGRSAMTALRERLETGVREITPGVRIVACEAERLPNTSCIALPGSKAESLVIALDLAGVAVSAGAACSSGKVTASHVLTAMGLPRDVVTGAIRVSLGWTSTQADVDRFLDAWAQVTRARMARASVA